LFQQREESIPHAPGVFSYEKPIAKLYQQIPKIIDSGEEDARELLLKAIHTGIPLAWPGVELRTDLSVSIPNDRLERIGSVRIGETPLYPEDYCIPGCHDMQKSESRQSPDTIEAENLPDSPNTVVAAALSQYHSAENHSCCMVREHFTFLEAGPRSRVLDVDSLTAAQHELNAGVVVSGGIAPGINAVIDGITRRHKLYGNTKGVKGYHTGFWGIANGTDADLLQKDTPAYATLGGSLLRTFRLDRLLEPSAEREECLKDMFRTLVHDKISFLYIIGGDGTMKAAHLLSRYAKRHGHPLSIIGIPKTMDNDILWMWQSFGFATAVEKAREIINDLSTEVHSNPRICVLQLFGSSSGFVVSHAVLASRTGQCDIAIIPEASFTIEGLAKRLLKLCSQKDAPRPIPYGMIVMAEAAVPDDWETYIDKKEIGLSGTWETKENGRLEGEKGAIFKYMQAREEAKLPQGQTPDELRSAGLKLVCEGVRLRLEELIADRKGGQRPEIYLYAEDMRVFSNEPRHILRATPPSSLDIITGQRLGALAVDNAMAGYTDFMISQWLTEYVMVPLRLASLGRKRIPKTGIFWKSVLAKTEQGNLDG
jgi:6-phosphofructokinase 1